MLPFTIQQLRILKAIATEKSFTKAAEILYLSQPALSKQIKALETNLNILLINRKKNQIYLTESGKILLNYSERILTLCEESYRVLVDLKNGERGTLIVGASQTVGIYVMPHILSLFVTNYPQIDLEVKVNSTPLVANSVINRKIDIAVVSGEISNDLKKNLAIEDFVYDELSLIISDAHPFAKKGRVKKKDLYYLNLITLNSNSNIKNFIDSKLIQNDIQIGQLKIILRLNSIEGIKTAVSFGLGAAFVSSSAIKKEIELKSIRVLKIENIRITRKLSIITNLHCYESRARIFFYEELLRLKQKMKN